MADPGFSDAPQAAAGLSDRAVASLASARTWAAAIATLGVVLALGGGLSLTVIGAAGPSGQSRGLASSGIFLLTAGAAAVALWGYWHHLGRALRGDLAALAPALRKLRYFWIVIALFYGMSLALGVGTWLGGR